ncbi:chloride channel CLIC-like protein 1 [Gambusia affinis]|uniref:chloride channel CLIC-like protein 1 n=1 Tax=Gambusia affinis TaxID=33528 RepID=UPI001CDD7AEE|nr:chloride channel CLIC-like protein 1 [Gambusia affinis]XP_043985430.1 chloride channel CLIC-like protein 1 [Gambusia affinis]
MLKKMEQAKKKAEAVVNTADISEREKMAQLKRRVQMDDEWLDIHDMLNYDIVAKRMRQTTETEPHWRSSSQHVEDLQRQIGMLVLILLAIICIKKSSGALIFWPLKFIWVLIFYFVVSILWSWLCVYQVAFFEHQNIIRKTVNLNEECKGIQEMDWTDGLKEGFRTSRPLHDDPCKDYYAFF